MAGHEDMANCKIRCMPCSQGGGLGVYATEDIEYAQELLIVNREYPIGMVEDTQVADPGSDAPTLTSADAGAAAAVR